MTFVGKVATGVISTGIVGGGFATSYYAFSNYETISAVLKQEGFEPLDTSKTSEDWKTVFKGYQVATENTFANGKDKTLNEEGLRSKCEALLKKKPNTKDYGLASQWCVREKEATKILERLKLRLLKTDVGTGNTINDQEHWTKKVQKYEENKPADFVVESLEGDAKTKATAMTKACAGLNPSTLKTTSNEFNKKINQIKEWCSVEEKENGK